MKIDGSKVRSRKSRGESELAHLQHKGASAKLVLEKQLFFFFFFLLLPFAIIACLTGPDGITSLPKTHQRESIS